MMNSTHQRRQGNWSASVVETLSLHDPFANTTDAATIAGFYKRYAVDIRVTVEDEAMGKAEMARRAADILTAELPCEAWRNAGKTLGYANSPTPRRSVENIRNGSTWDTGN